MTDKVSAETLSVSDWVYFERKLISCTCGNVYHAKAKIRAATDIREPQREGIAVAKRKGVYKGRRRSLNEEQVAQIIADVRGA
ncbi:MULTISPECIES: hypothetical protein [unclassified Bradyrhizobium]|uniref:hypothetical protein n=1 Tax=unclassified Bradyrhizobium TaxID=2631580 RepID=UPI001FF99623|nr:MULTISPECIES: hypothetical protein [unclassified Bradyrhizobium]